MHTTLEFSAESNQVICSQSSNQFNHLKYDFIVDLNDIDPSDFKYVTITDNIYNFNKQLKVDDIKSRLLIFKNAKKINELSENIIEITENIKEFDEIVNDLDDRINEMDNIIYNKIIRQTEIYDEIYDNIEKMNNIFEINELYAKIDNLNYKLLILSILTSINFSIVVYLLIHSFK